MKTRRSMIGVCSALMLAVGATADVAAETKGPVTDDIGVLMIKKGAPIFIGGYWSLSGAEISLGLDQKRGAEIAFDDHGNTVAGHQIRLLAEDSQCSAEGGQTAATKIAANENVVAVLGPDCSSSATAAAPILWKAGMVNVGTSSSAPKLTAPDRKAGYHGFLRTIYNDLHQGRADARWFQENLTCKTLATVHDGSPYTEQLVRVAEEEFKKRGGTIVATEAVAPTDVDMRPMLTRIATSKPCVLYFPIFTAAGAQVIRQIPEIGGLKGTHAIGGSAMAAPGFLAAAGDSAVGLRFTKPDATTEALGKRYPDLLQKYKTKYGETPTEVFHSNAYDAAEMVLNAIEKVAQKDGDGNTYIGRKALRDALFATKGHDGVSGPINCDENGDCADFKFAVYEWVSSDPATFEIGKNPKKIHPGN